MPASLVHDSMAILVIAAAFIPMSKGTGRTAVHRSIAFARYGAGMGVAQAAAHRLRDPAN